MWQVAVHVCKVETEGNAKEELQILLERILYSCGSVLTDIDNDGVESVLSTLYELYEQT